MSQRSDNNEGPYETVFIHLGTRKQFDEHLFLKKKCGHQ